MKWLFTIFISSIALVVNAQQKLSFTSPSATIEFNTVLEYRGEVSDGKANGYGEARSKSGITYKGYWKNNYFHGKGILSNDKGILYEGDFADGEIHGKGKRYYYDGSTYEGDFVNGWQTGQGVKIHNDGRREEGRFFQNEFKDAEKKTVTSDKPVAATDPGNGSLVFRIPYYVNPDIELMVMYRGAVKDDRADGYGEATINRIDSYTGNKYFATYKGEWKNNNFHGKGLLAYDGGSSYEGDFLNGRPHGKVIYQFEGGGNYTGDFVNGKRQGKGITTYSDGSKKEGEWYDDQFRGDGNTIPKEYVKEITAEDRAREAEEKARAAKEAQAKLQKEKDEKDPCKMGWNVYGFKRGLTRMYNGDYVILMEFDCKKDEYKIWRPEQKRAITGYVQPNFSYKVPGDEFRRSSFEADQHWYTCKACDGDGTEEITVYTTKTKELPWGYFSGIETKRITTTSKTYNQICKVCKGAAVLLKKK